MKSLIRRWHVHRVLKLGKHRSSLYRERFYVHPGSSADDALLTEVETTQRRMDRHVNKLRQEA